MFRRRLKEINKSIKRLYAERKVILYALKRGKR